MVASPGSNATWAKQPRYYHTLSQDSVAYWHELQGTLDIPVHWGGSLEWYDTAERTEWLARQIAEQAEWGERSRMVDAAELAELEPNVDFGGAQMAAFAENDGAVDPAVATRLLLQAAEAAGATVIYPCELTGVSRRDGKLVGIETSCGPIETDKLVLATGAAPDAAKMFADSDIPQRSRPGVIAVTEPMPRIINRIIAAPGIHMHQRDDGCIVIGEQEGAPENEAHALRLADRPNNFPEQLIAEQHAQRMLAVAIRFAPAIEGAVFQSVRIGWRPLPLDGHPVLGASPARPDVYLAVMHSGVTLAPIVGKLLAQEISSGVSVEQLEPFRPGREFELIKRY